MIMKHTTRTLLAVLLTALCSFNLISCESTTDTGNGPTPVTNRSVFVLNQGGFGKTNASLDVISLKTDSVQSNVLPHLGDVGNDIKLINGKLYVVLDNSQKIEVLDPSTLKEVTAITFPAGSIPTKIEQISANEAVVSDGGYVNTTEMYVIDLATNTITSRITVGTSTGGLATLNGSLFATTSTNELLQINASSKSVTGRTPAGDVPMYAIADSGHNKVIVFSAGNYFPSKTPGSIRWINPNSLALTDSIMVDTNTYIAALVPALSAKKMFILYGAGVGVLDLDTKKITTTTFIGTSKSFLGGTYDASTNELYLGTGDFSSNGKVEVYDATTGALKRSYNAGIAPSFFTFYP